MKDGIAVFDGISGEIRLPLGFAIAVSKSRGAR
jgi:hypothetical protein